MYTLVLRHLSRVHLSRANFLYSHDLSDAQLTWNKVYHKQLVINVRLSNMMSYSIEDKICNHEKVYLYIFDRQVKLRTPTSNGFFCVQTT